MRRLALLVFLFASGGCDDGPGGGAPPAPDALAPDALATDALAPDAALDAAPLADVGPLPPDAALPPCTPVPSDEALLPATENQGGPWLAPGGRRLSPAGLNVVVPGFSTGVLVHPDRGVVYLTSASDDDRRLIVLDAATGDILQDVDRDEAFYGLALAGPDRLFASAGDAGRVDAFAVQPDGTLVADGAVETGGYPAGLAYDAGLLYVGLFNEPRIVEVDAATAEERRRFPTSANVWDLLLLPARRELYASSLQGDGVSVIDLEAGALARTIPLPVSPAGMAADPDGSRLWVAVSGADVVVALDPATGEVTATGHAAGDDLVDAEGAPYPNTNVNALAYDAARGRLYASRGADNAVSVLDAADLRLLGEIPTSWYPTDVALAGPDRLIVAEGKGGGAGPNRGEGVKQVMKGSATFVDLARLDLAATTAQARADFQRARAAFPFTCDGRFPIPTQPGQRSPIEHIVLIVKENKTFDCVFGDLDDPRADVDPSLLRFGEEVTPNLHALARAFALSDNFYTEVENSDTGHLFLTGGHLTELVERIWIERARTDQFQGYQLTRQAAPKAGNFFTHLMNHDVSQTIYGEIVGMFIDAEGRRGRPVQYSDSGFPGGAFYNTSEPDENKARYVVERIQAGELAAFTYLLLPNDHTEGTRAGSPTPESMVADNDYAVGLVVEALSRSPFWPRTAIVILQDDPQGCQDHVDAHRSPLLVVSPYARRGHLSKVNASFSSVFATFTAILGLPPMGRPDASAAPLYDMFTATADLTPYTALPRRIPVTLNPEDGMGSDKSARMDFHGPDRNPALYPILDAYRLWQMGRISRAEAERRVATLQVDPERWALLEEEAEEEIHAFDGAFAAYQAWRREQGLPPAVIPPRARPLNPAPAPR
ncbi:MAG: hypothetical protein H6706_15240 [Myxococcales bacterium]|nr:hypothetical protein [Myxococcales bacterium]